MRGTKAPRFATPPSQTQECSFRAEARYKNPTRRNTILVLEIVGLTNRPKPESLLVKQAPLQAGSPRRGSATHPSTSHPAQSSRADSRHAQPVGDNTTPRPRSKEGAPWTDRYHLRAEAQAAQLLTDFLLIGAAARTHAARPPSLWLHDEDTAGIQDRSSANLHKDGFAS